MFLHELNTLDACWIAVDVWSKIVVDVGKNWSTNIGHDAYIHDHCFEYHHTYALFYQLPNNNLSTHRMLYFERETSSENYGPQV